MHGLDARSLQLRSVVSVIVTCAVASMAHLLQSTGWEIAMLVSGWLEDVISERREVRVVEDWVIEVFVKDKSV